MDHPFTCTMELTELEQKTVSGGSQIRQVSQENRQKYKPVIKPAIGSTMAIGEEGGSFNHF